MTDINIEAHDPQTVKLIALCDPHFSASKPSVFKVPYLDFLEDNVNQVVDFAEKNQVDAMLWAGDIFHLKEPKNNPAWLLSRLNNLFLSYWDRGLPQLGIGGNHDYKYGQIDSGFPGSPLENIVSARAFHLLDEDEYVVSADGFSVRLAGGSYLHGQASHVRDKEKKGSDFLVALGHFWLGNQTGEFFGEALYGMDYFQNSEVDALIVGHHHEDKGCVEAFGKKFISHGSISITGAHPHDLTRKPAAAYLEITKEGISVKFLRPKIPAIEDLLDLNKHKEIKREKAEVEKFIEDLSEMDVSFSDPKDILQEITPSGKLRDKVVDYLEKAETDE